jgi:hypothetical protein
MSGHLSQAEISEWLAGIRADGAERHLAECAGCAVEAKRASQPFERFGAAARAWGEAEMPAAWLTPAEWPTPPAWLAPEKTAPAPRRGWRLAGAGLALAAAALLLVAVPVRLQRQRALELARQDEALLEAVQTEVARSAPEPMQPLEKLVVWNSPSGQSDSSQ